MQNKGFVRFFAISLALVCLFYLSFTFVTNYWDKQAKEIAQGDSQKYYEYLEEISGEEKWQQTAVEVSPLLQQAKLGIEQSKQSEKIVKAERLPSVALIAGDHLDGPVTIEVPPINKNFN